MDRKPTIMFIPEKRLDRLKKSLGMGKHPDQTSTTDEAQAAILATLNDVDPHDPSKPLNDRGRKHATKIVDGWAQSNVSGLTGNQKQQLKTLYQKVHRTWNAYEKLKFLNPRLVEDFRKAAETFLSEANQLIPKEELINITEADFNCTVTEKELESLQAEIESKKVHEIIARIEYQLEEARDSCDSNIGKADRLLSPNQQLQFEKEYNKYVIEAYDAHEQAMQIYRSEYINKFSRHSIDSEKIQNLRNHLTKCNEQIELFKTLVNNVETSINGKAAEQQKIKDCLELYDAGSKNKALEYIKENENYRAWFNETVRHSELRSSKLTQMRKEMNYNSTEIGIDINNLNPLSSDAHTLRLKEYNEINEALQKKLQSPGFTFQEISEDLLSGEINGIPDKIAENENAVKRVVSILNNGWLVETKDWYYETLNAQEYILKNEKIGRSVALKDFDRLSSHNNNQKNYIMTLMAWGEGSASKELRKFTRDVCQLARGVAQDQDNTLLEKRYEMVQLYYKIRDAQVYINDKREKREIEDLLDLEDFGRLSNQASSIEDYHTLCDQFQGGKVPSLENFTNLRKETYHLAGQIAQCLKDTKSIDKYTIIPIASYIPQFGEGSLF